MKEGARGLVIGSIVLALALPVLYVGTEGAWYLATGESHFASGSTYRTVYAPLDWAGDRWPQVYGAREGLANGWLRLIGDPAREARVRRNLLPSPYYAMDGRDIQIFPENEFKLSREAAAMQQSQEERDSAAAGASDANSPGIDASSPLND